MVISKNFNRLFWGTVINDIKVNLKYPIKLNHKVFGYVQVDLKQLLAYFRYNYNVID